MADGVIGLLMDEHGYKYCDKVLGRTNDVSVGLPWASRGPSVLLYAKLHVLSGTPPRKAHPEDRKSVV